MYRVAKTPCRLVVCAFGLAVPLGLLMLGGCPVSPDGQPAAAREPTGADLFARLQSPVPYDQWARFPDAQGTLVSSFPHGPMSRVFINNKVEQALSQFDGELPDGSIIVKENIGENPGEKAGMLTVMWKVKGFNPDGGDWFWAAMSPDGQISAAGRVESCMNCHAGASANDYVFVHQFQP